MAITTLGSKAVESIVKIKESGKLVEFYVAKHNYESSRNGNGRTLVVRKDCYDTRQWHSSNGSVYATSAIDTWLNGTYKNLLDADIRKAIGTTKFLYTPSLGSSTTGELSRSVFLLSVTELGKTPNYTNTEGSALACASTLQIAKLNGSAIDQWTRTINKDIGKVFRLDTDKNSINTSPNSTSGCRPAFTLPASAYVLDDGTVIVNTAPTISCSSSSGSDLGTKEDGFVVSYSTDDADGDAVTVTESIDGVQHRKYTATLKQSNNFSITDNDGTFMKLLNGKHTLTITASDGKATTTHTLTFTKSVTSSSVMLAEPMEADDQITICALSISGSIPDDANFKVEVTNNANDDAPVWEDCTASVTSGANIVFRNDTAEKGWAFSFRINVKRGPSGVGGYITSVQGGFE